MSNIVPMQYRCCWTACRDSVWRETGTSSSTSAIAKTTRLPKRIHDAGVSGQIHRVFGQDRRGLQRAAEVRAPESLSRADVERLHPTVEGLHADHRLAGHGRGREGPQRLRFPERPAV